jgi:hypothetical protein
MDAHPSEVKLNLEDLRLRWRGRERTNLTKIINRKIVWATNGRKWRIFIHGKNTLLGRRWKTFNPLQMHLGDAI